MRTIELVVPDGRCTDEWWSRCSENVVADVLDAIGALMATRGNGDADEQIKALRQQLEGANDAAQGAARATTARIEEVWAARMREKEAMVGVLQEQCASFKSMAEQARAACEAQQRNTDAIVKTLQQQERTGTMTAQQLGGVAEAEVERVVVDTLACDVEDVSHLAGPGDRRITTPDGLRLMLEVKNVERLHSKHDLEKFRNDAYNGAKDGRINAALLVSLRTTSIPNVSGTCSVTFMNTDTARVPVLLLASNSRPTIQLAVHAAAQLQLLAARETAARGGVGVPVQLETLERERGILQRALPSVLKFVHENDTAVESRIEMLQRLLDDAMSERTRQKEVMFQLAKLQQSVSWIGASQEATDMDVAVSIVLKWYERKNEFPKTSEMTMPQRTAIKAAGGLKVVTDVARKRQRGDEEPSECA